MVMLTWPIEGQEFGWEGVLGTKRDEVQVLDTAVVVSHHTKTAPTAEIREEGDVGHLLLLRCWVEADQAQLLGDAEGEESSGIIKLSQPISRASYRGQ